MKFDHIGAEQGLSHFSPSCIIQDKQGFLWFGTEDGLNRYDGYNFTVYRNSPRDSNSIAANGISGLCIDTDGNLWMTSASSEAQSYDVNTGKFVRYKLRHENMLPGQQPVLGNMLADEDGMIWVATNSGLSKFNARTGHVEKIFLHDSSSSSTLTSDVVRHLCKDSSGSIWVGTINGVNRLDKRTNNIARYFLGKQPGLSKRYNDIFTLEVDGRGVVWIGTGGGLLSFDPRTNQFVPSSFKLPSGSKVGEIFIYSMFVDAQGVLWVGSYYDGLLKHEPATDSFVQQLNDPNNPRSIANNRISCIYQDRSGVLWVGMYRTGLSRYDRRKDQFTIYPVPGQAYAVAEISYGNVWIGTSGEGIFVYRKGIAEAERFRYDPKNPGALSNDNVYSFHEEANGDVWVGVSSGLDRYIRTTGRFKHYRFAHLPPLNDNLETKAIYADKDGDLWVGSNGVGLLRYDRTHDSFLNYRNDPNNPHSISGGGVWSIYQDSKKRLWVPTFGGGLNLLDKSRNSFNHFVHSDSDTNSLSADAIYCIAEDTRGRLWLGTFGGGLNRLDTTSWKFKTYRVEDGLPDNFVKAIVPDAHGNLWLSTDKGLSYFDTAEETFKNYKEQNGLHGNVFLSGSWFKNKYGKLYFGGTGGVTAFHPDSLKPKEYRPPVVLTSFKVFDKVYPLEKSIMLTNRISLAHDENSVSFEFVSLDYSLPENNTYSYKLEGIDHDWVQAGTRRYASYNQIPSGEYVFNVRGSNSDGLWSDNVATVLLAVAPPIWGTWWFRILAILVVFALGALIYNYRVNRLLEIERLRVRIASDLHDDIGSSLTKISLQSELIQEGYDPGDQQNYLRNIATMSRELVTSMSDIVWSIDARNDTMENLLDKMKGFASSTLAVKDIAMTFAHSGVELKKKLPVDVRENLYLIFKEAVNNIAKHSDASGVNVVIRNDSDKFSMIIIDDGKGWAGNERLNGHGIKNMRMRAERLGGTIEFVRDEGTRVVLTIKRI